MWTTLVIKVRSDGQIASFLMLMLDGQLSNKVAATVRSMNTLV